MTGIPATSLIGLPWQIAFALHDDGWIIRNAIVWHHPDTQTAQPGCFAPSYELIFLLVKQKDYYFDLHAIRQPPAEPEPAADPSAVHDRGPAQCRNVRPGTSDGNGNERNVADCRSCHHRAALPPTGSRHAAAHPTGKTLGDVWSFAAPPLHHDMPIELPLRCIAAGCRPGGTVLDPFTAIGTTGIAARTLGPPFIGIESDPALCDLAAARLSRIPGPAERNLE